MTAIVPSSAEPIGQGGVLVTQTWLRFFNDLVGSAQPIVSVVPSGSPFAYTAPSNGAVSLFGGTFSGVTLTRARTAVHIAGNMIPVMNGDVVTVTYSVAPTISFIPS